MHLISMGRPFCVHLLGENSETRDNRESKETLPALVHIMFESPEDVTSIPERRAHARLRVDSRAPLDLGTGCTGTILNVSEGGLAARVPVTLTQHSPVPCIRFRLPISEGWLELNGQIVWVSKSKTEVGIKFVDLQEGTRSKLRRWISQQPSQLPFERETEMYGRTGQLSSPDSACHLREVRLDQDWQPFSNGWRECNSRFHEHTIHCDPDWMEEHFKRQKENVRIYFFERESQIIGAVPFVLSNQRLLCELGPFVAAKLPFRFLTLQGYTPNMPAETSFYDMLFDRILQAEFDVIQLSHVKTPSFLWSYLRSSPMIRECFSFYTPWGVSSHSLIHLSGSFASYMNKFSPKARKNRRREIRRLRACGDMQFMRVTKISQIDEFLEAAHEISQKTWQFVRYRWGIGARDFDVVRSEMHFLAQRGWLRGYLLKCGTVPCSFIIAQQYGQTLYTAAAGVHPDWRSYSAGTVLLLLVLEDLFNENSIQFYDLAGHAKYKEHFANESYQEALVYLFRRRAYPLLASGIYRTCRVTSRIAGAVLDKLNLKSRVRRLRWD